MLNIWYTLEMAPKTAAICPWGENAAFRPMDAIHVRAYHNPRTDGNDIFWRRL